MKVKFLICCLVLSPIVVIHAQPNWETYIHNNYVNENIFLKQTLDATSPPNFKTAVNQLPEPFWVARPNVIKCYWKTWEIAYSNLHPVELKSGFVYPLLDAAFNGDIYMWENSFMLMFLKYGIHSFNFLPTLNNFYCKQHPDGFICREIRRSDGTDTFERWAVLSTGLNIMPWAEWEYYTNLNDTARLKQNFPVLLAYYQWFKANRSWPDGSYFATGQSSGINNQPRISENENPQAVNHSTGHISWIDATLQQIIAGKVLIEMGNIINRTADTRLLITEVAYLTDYVNRNMYDSIAVLFEYVFGIRTNVPENTLVWDIRLTDAFGIKKYPF